VTRYAAREALRAVADTLLRWPRLRWIPAPVRVRLEPYLSPAARDHVARGYLERMFRS
jgi:hypothetical protein